MIFTFGNWDDFERYMLNGASENYQKLVTGYSQIGHGVIKTRKMTRNPGPDPKLGPGPSGRAGG